MGRSHRQVLAACAAVGLWSTNAWAAEVALARMSLGWLLLVQFGAAASALLLGRTAAARRPSRIPRSLRPAPAAGQGPAAGGRGWSIRAVGVGVLGLTATIVLQYLAFATSPIVAANVLSYGWPLLAALAVAATVRSRRAVALAGLAMLGFVGVALIFTSPAADLDTAAGSDATWGYVAAAASALCMAGYTLGAGKLNVPVTDLLIPATLAGVVVAVAITIADPGPWPGLAGWVAAGYIGLGPMAAGYGLWTLAMAHDGAERLSPLGYATPLLSTGLLLATGAPASTRTLTGIGLILACSAGVLAAQCLQGRRQLTEHPETTPSSGQAHATAVAHPPTRRPPR